jgi:hypothetical protein
MSSGGYRPGAGRKPGSKDKTPRKVSNVASEDRKTIKEMLKMGTTVKAKFYQEYLLRINAGQTLSTTEKRMMQQLGVELGAAIGEDKLPTDILDGAAAQNITPLAYMLEVMNNPKAPIDTRCRMAGMAAPYCHPRKGYEGDGLKQQRADKAVEAGKGRFAPSRQPLALVK